MLFAVEGGGFFSSSASGYSKGLTLLLLGQKSEEKPMRVTPWSQYQLVDQDPDPDLQLASGKARPAHGCASFVCFSCAANGGVESPSPLKVGPTRNQEVLPESPRVFDESESPENNGDDDDSKTDIVILKSSLKKTSNGAGNETSRERNNGIDCQAEKKVQWTDAIGEELFEIREFETSDDGSDGDFDHASGKTCSCSIM